MTCINELIRIIHEYEFCIKMFSSIVEKTYKISVSPFVAKNLGLIPTSGTISTNGGMELKFHFHGLGCYFELNSIAVDFDYEAGSFIYNGFFLEKILLFIRNSPLICTDLVNESFFYSLIVELEKNGVLNKSCISESYYNLLLDLEMSGIKVANYSTNAFKYSLNQSKVIFKNSSSD